MSKIHSCKIGTVPMAVTFKHNYKVVVGKKILVRRYEINGHKLTGYKKYFQVYITKINPDGYFFADRL